MKYISSILLLTLICSLLFTGCRTKSNASSANVTTTPTTMQTEQMLPTMETETTTATTQPETTTTPSSEKRDSANTTTEPANGAARNRNRTLDGGMRNNGTNTNPVG